MKNNQEIVIGHNWKLVSHFAAKETLIFRTGVYNEEKLIRNCWSAIDVAKMKSKVLSTRSQPTGCSPVFWKRAGELIFASRQGITAFALAKEEERIVAPHDWESFAVSGLWLAPSPRAELLYLLGERAVPWSQLIHQAAKTGESVPLSLRYSLHILNLDSGKSKSIATFRTMPTISSVDWGSNSVFAILGSAITRQLARIGLATRKIAHIRTVNRVSGVAITPNHTFLTWGMSDPNRKITETSRDGEKISAIDFGWLPAVAPDGGRFAFTVGDYELWIKDFAQDTPEKIISFQQSGGLHTCDRPVWCLCGQHFSVCLVDPKTGKSNRKTLVIVDCKNKIVVVENVSTTSGERLWVPTEAMSSLIERHRRQP